MIKTLFSLVFLFSFAFPSLADDNPNPWALRKTIEDIPVYTRKVDGSPILEYKSTVTIDAPLYKALELFEDQKQIPRWYYQCVFATLIKNEDPKNRVIYLILHFPWPVVPRDFVFRRSRTDDPKTGAVTYSLTALPKEVPLAKGMIRVSSIKSIWVFTPLPHNQTQLFFQQHTDPAGSIPPTILNKMCVDTPYYSLKNFRKLLTKKDT